KPARISRLSASHATSSAKASRRSSPISPTKSRRRSARAPDPKGDAMSDDGTNNHRYRRVLLKLSGESLAGEGESGISPQVVGQIAGELRDVKALGCDLAVVVGGGNIFRGLKAAEMGMDRATGDYMGMLSTVLNSLALQD